MNPIAPLQLPPHLSLSSPQFPTSPLEREREGEAILIHLNPFLELKNAMKQQLSSRAKDNPRPESANGSSPLSKPRLRPAAPANPNTTQRAAAAARSAHPPVNRTAEHYAPRLRTRGDRVGKGPEDRTAEPAELQRRLEAKECTVKELESETAALKARVEELESQNRRLAEKLSAAEAKIETLENHHQAASNSKEFIQPSGFRNERKLIVHNLDPIGTKEVIREDRKANTTETSALDSRAKSSKIHPNTPMATGPPPPPPPPPRAPTRANTAQKASPLVELYNSLTKRDGMKDPLGTKNRGSPVAISAHNSIVGELQNRSSHLLAIKADVETKGDFIKHLIEEVQSAEYTDMEDVSAFVDWIDRQLSTLADERAVLKHFNWPESKADALREASFGYRDLKRIEVEVSSFEDDGSLPIETTLKKIENLLGKLERGVHRLIKLRETTMVLYRGYKIPTDWMIDSGMVSKMKKASVRLAKVYMKRVAVEHELLRHSERELLLFQGVRFAYRVHKFAGGLDSETMCAFEQLKEQVQALHGGQGPRDLIQGTSRVANLNVYP